jgi:hypothetical protein
VRSPLILTAPTTIIGINRPRMAGYVIMPSAIPFYHISKSCLVSILSFIHTGFRSLPDDVTMTASSLIILCRLEISSTLIRCSTSRLSAGSLIDSACTSTIKHILTKTNNLVQLFKCFTYNHLKDSRLPVLVTPSL